MNSESQSPKGILATDFAKTNFAKTTHFDFVNVIYF